MGVKRLALLVLLFVACHRAVGPGGIETLEGLTLPLASSPALRLVVSGTVDDIPAEITFDPAQPVTFITSKCVPNPTLTARVTVPDPFGPDETFPLTNLEGLRIGSALFRGLQAAVASGKTCVVVLGAPELRGLAIELNPALREVHFRHTQSRERWSTDAEASGDDVQVLPITREPRFDWPLLPVRLRQGPKRLDATMLLSLRDAKSRVYDQTARAAGLRPGLELLEGLPLPDGVTLPPELSQLRGYAWDALELAPGFGLTDGSLEIEQGQPPHAAQGMLGADVWGRFSMTLDLGSDVLVLRRPRIFVSGSRAQCARGGVSTEEACFEVHSQISDGGVDVTATVWRPLPEGARLSLDLTGGTGACHVGVTFSPGDRGRSTQHHFPWARLGDSIPRCGDAFVGVTDATPGLLEDGPMPECPGVCAWARDSFSGRMSCECQPGARAAGGEAEKRLLELFKRALDSLKPKKEVEPSDPD